MHYHCQVAVLFKSPSRAAPTPCSAASLGPPSSQGLDLNLLCVSCLGPVWETQEATSFSVAPYVRAGLEEFVVNN